MKRSFVYKDYRIENVYKTLSDDHAQLIIDFWLRNNALPNPLMAEQRVKQVVMMILNKKDEVVGVSTIYRQPYKGDNRQYFFYRMFIQPGDRIFGMMAFVTGQTYEYLKQLCMADKPEGLIVITENQKIMRKGSRRALERLGFDFMGKEQRGLDVWLGKI